jgi:glucose/arabinose dehydrogenase
VRSRRYGIAAALFAAVLIAGCSTDDDDGPAASPAATGTQRGGSADGSEVEAAARRPVRLLRLGRFSEPTYLTAPRGDTRRFVVERSGRIVIVKGGRVLDEPFLDISGQVSTGGESGLLSMAFAPDYAESGRFYVYYTDQRGYINVAQYRRQAGNPDRADAASRRTVILVPHQRFNHKGGQIQFGPDGRLYAAFGDGGGGGDPDDNAQNLSRMLGKLIRIEPRPGGGYSIPRSNPFRARSGARGEIFAYGLRNPYRFSFDRRSGALTIGDVGQDSVEEIDYTPGRGGDRAPRAGDNFGWDVWEGRRRYEGGSARGHVPPAIAHSQDGGYCSIIGGYVIRDRSLGRGWTGRYVYGDYCNPAIRLARLRSGRSPNRATRLRVPGLVSFGEDGQGRVYAISLNGPVYRLGVR